MSVPSLTNICQTKQHTVGEKTASVKLFWWPKTLRLTLFKIQASSHLCFDSVTANREQKRMHHAHPSGLQEIPLALHAVLNVDQTQQVLLEKGMWGT